MWVPTLLRARVTETSWGTIPVRCPPVLDPVPSSTVKGDQAGPHTMDRRHLGRWRGWLEAAAQPCPASCQQHRVCVTGGGWEHCPQGETRAGETDPAQIWQTSAAGSHERCSGQGARTLLLTVQWPQFPLKSLPAQAAAPAPDPAHLQSSPCCLVSKPSNRCRSSHRSAGVTELHCGQRWDTPGALAG